MEGIPAWLQAAFSKRIDTLGQYMHSNPRHQLAWGQAAEMLDKFLSTLSKEQHQAFGEWEDKIGLQEANEKEEMYVRGFLDGFQAYACLHELMDDMAVKDRHYERPPVSDSSMS